MFGAFTNDVISEYAYGFSSNWVQAPLFNKVFLKWWAPDKKMGSSMTEMVAD